MSYLIQIYETPPGGVSTLLETWQPGSVGAWTDFVILPRTTPGTYVYEIRMSDPGNGGISRGAAIGMALKR